jgi:prolycopene isomerase
VIAACDVESLYEKMLPEGTVGKKAIRKIRNAERYNSCVTVSIGLDCSPADFGLGEEQILLKRDGVMPEGQAAEAPDKVEISIIAPSVRDPSLAPEGKGIITIYAPCSIQYGNFWNTERGSAQEFIRGQAYRSFKGEYADTLLRRVEETVVCGLRKHIQIMDIATPITYQRYTGNRDGAIMSFRPTLSNIRNGVAHHFTPVKNLFVGSQWAELGGGVPMAVKAGMNSALLILKQEVPEVFTLLCDVIDGRVSPEDVSSPYLRSVNEDH